MGGKKKVFSVVKSEQERGAFLLPLNRKDYETAYWLTELPSRNIEVRETRLVWGYQCPGRNRTKMLMYQTLDHIRNGK